MIFLVAVLAFYVAWNLGANDVANAMGTSVGSKAVTLRQAIAIAGVLEFAGAVVFDHAVSETLTTEIVNPALLEKASFPSKQSSGLCAELATATTILLASHALVGGVVGIGLIQSTKSIQFKTLQGIGWAWLITIPISAGLGGIFTVARLLFL